MTEEHALFAFNQIREFFTNVCPGIMGSKHGDDKMRQRRVLVVKKHLCQLLTRMVHRGDQNVARYCKAWLGPLKDVLEDAKQHTENIPQFTVMDVVWV